MNESVCVCMHIFKNIRIVINERGIFAMNEIFPQSVCVYTDIIKKHMIEYFYSCGDTVFKNIYVWVYSEK
jgi:hypothetical protein